MRSSKREHLPWADLIRSSDRWWIMGDQVTIPSASLYAQVMLQWVIVKTQPSSNSYSDSDLLTNFGNCRTQVCCRHRLRSIVAGVVIAASQVPPHCIAILCRSPINAIRQDNPVLLYLYLMFPLVGVIFGVVWCDSPSVARRRPGGVVTPFINRIIATVNFPFS